MQAKITVNPVTPQDAINLLNQAAALDPDAMLALVNNRVFCNEGLGEHPTILVDTTEDGIPHVGLLGILNGLFGVDENTTGAIVALIPTDPRDKISFFLNEHFAE